MMPFAARYAVPTILAAGLAATSSAAELLAEQATTGKSWRVEVRVEASQTTSSVLLAAPLGEKFSVEWRGERAVSSLEVRPFQMYRTAGVQVLVGPREMEGTFRLESLAPLASAERAPLPAVARSAFLNDAAFAPARLDRTAAAAALPEAPGTWRASFEGLLPVVRVPLSPLGLTGAEADEIAVLHEGKPATILSSDSEGIWIYAAPAKNRFGRLDAIFLSHDATGPSPMASVQPAFSTLSPTGQETAHWISRRIEQNNRHEPLLPAPVLQRFAFYRVGNPPSANHQPQAETLLSLHDKLASLDLTLRLLVWGFQDWQPSNPDHFADFTLDGVSLPRLEWEGRVLRSLDHTLTLPASSADATSLTLVHTVPGDSPTVSSGGLDMQLLEAVELTIYAFPRADAEGVAMVERPYSEFGEIVSLGGFPAGTTAADLLLFRVEEEKPPILLSNPAMITAPDGTVAVEFEHTGPSATYVAQRLDRAATPLEVVETEALPGVPADPIRQIMVRPAALASAAAPLVAERGSGVLELNPQAAYNAYNDGREDPEALRSALRDLLAAAPALPADQFPAILLLGSGTLDPWNYLGGDPAPTVPPFVEPGFPDFFGALENAVDYPYALLVGNDLIPDAQVGRIPAATAEDLQRAVDRILAFDAQAPALAENEARSGVFIADREPQFVADQPLWTGFWDATGLPSVRIDLDPASDGAAERAAITAALEAPNGAAFVLYTGHGNNDRWGSRNIWNAVDAGTVDTDGRWPLVATFTCLNGSYAVPGNGITLAEQWLFAEPESGAVANIAPAGVDLYANQLAFSQILVETLTGSPSQRPATVGELLLRTQLQFLAANPTLEITLKEYLLFGDPLTPLILNNPTSSVGEFWMLR